MENRGEVTKVPCNGCTLCCRHGLDSQRVMARKIPLYPEELEKFKNMEVKTPDGPVPYLATTLRGDCVYLGPGGCAVHGDKPLYCRHFDCRDMPKLFSRAMARERSRYRGKIFYQVWQKGYSLLREEQDERSKNRKRNTNASSKKEDAS